MATVRDSNGTRPVWLVGAAFGGNDDQSDRFINEGVWENGYQDRYLEEVKSICVGDRLAIKATYTKKHDLPFNTRGNSVSVMAIKAVGRVTDNLGDGRRLTVDWTPVEPKREWYFSTYQRTVTRVNPQEDDYKSKSLIDFVFERKDQDIDKFRNLPEWRDKFGDIPQSESRTNWTSFFTEFADRLLTYRNDRQALLGAIYTLPEERVRYLTDRFADGTSGRLTDICPFTTMGIFNRRVKWKNRVEIANELAELLGMEGQSLQKIDGIPTLDPRSSWFFPFKKERADDHIEALWQVFADALQYADDVSEQNRASLIDSFDKAVARPYVGRQLTSGLFWIRPQTFVSLDGHTTRFMRQRWGMDVPEGKPSGATYLSLCEELQRMIADESVPVHSLVELSVDAWHAPPEDTADTVPDQTGDTVPQDTAEAASTAPVDGKGSQYPDTEQPYSIEDIVEDGCFLERTKLEATLKQWRVKKNLILQGPPGTGKTWLAKRLGFALMGSRSPNRMRPLQFHPNLSYEDFVRGWRPSDGSDIRLSLEDGPFLRTVEQANNDPKQTYVVVIEEINRGNPAQIFGEMLTLLEADKRTPDEALALSYPRHPNERLHIPENLYVVGTMNVADRSLALVDIALRRRFAFVDLEPIFGHTWRSWVSKQTGLDGEFLKDIERRLTTLNQTISEDDLLGPQYQIGHSYVTPNSQSDVPDPVEWFKQVVDTEIVPLLNEYWFDATRKARSAREDLLKGLGS